MRILVKNLRNKLELTQKEFSEKSKISHRYLQNIETGDRIPSLSTLYKIAKTFNVKLDDLVD
jgi:transcriptional regulator with XRE-family HTH domain